MADISLLVAKVTFVVAKMIFMENVITSSVAKIMYIYIVAEITFKVTEVTFKFCLDHLCSDHDNF